MFGRSLYPGLGTSVNDKTVSDKKNNKQQRSRFTFAGPAFSFNGSMVVTAMGLVAMLPDHGIHLYIYVVMRMPLHSGICRSDLVLHHDELNISMYVSSNLVTISCTLVLGFSLRSSHTSHQQQFLRSRSLCCKVNQSMFSSSSSSHVTHHFG